MIASIATEVHSSLLSALEELQKAEANAVTLFGRVMHEKLYRELGYSSIHLYARQALGFSAPKTFHSSVPPFRADPICSTILRARYANPICVIGCRV